MNPKLIHITHIISEDGEKTDIEDEKIYLDSELQYRHKFHCPDCDRLVGCFCFRSLKGALYEAQNPNVYCHDCWLQDQLYDTIFETDNEDLILLIDKLENSKIMSLILAIDTLEDPDIYPNQIPNYRLQRAHDLRTNIREHLKILSPETLDAVHDYLMENYDYDFSGNSCEI